MWKTLSVQGPSKNRLWAGFDPPAVAWWVLNFTKFQTSHHSQTHPITNLDGELPPLPQRQLQGWWRPIDLWLLLLIVFVVPVHTRWSCSLSRLSAPEERGEGYLIHICIFCVWHIVHPLNVFTTNNEEVNFVLPLFILKLYLFILEMERAGGGAEGEEKRILGRLHTTYRFPHGAQSHDPDLTTWAETESDA